MLRKRRLLQGRHILSSCSGGLHCVPLNSPMPVAELLGLANSIRRSPHMRNVRIVWICFRNCHGWGHSFLPYTGCGFSPVCSKCYQKTEGSGRSLFCTDLFDAGVLFHTKTTCSHQGRTSGLFEERLSEAARKSWREEIYEFSPLNSAGKIFLKGSVQVAFLRLSNIVNILLCRFAGTAFRIRCRLFSKG